MSKKLKLALISLAGLVCVVVLALVIVPVSCMGILLWWHSINPSLELQLEKTPRLNEPVKLTCIRRLNIESTLRSMANLGTTPGTEHEKISVTVMRQDLKTASTDLEITPSDILVEGNFNWEATVTVDKSLNRIQVSPPDALAVDYLDVKSAESDGVPLVFSATIKFPKEGNWGIIAESEYHRNPDGGPGDSIFLNVTEDSGSFGWPKDYRPAMGGCYPQGFYIPNTVYCTTTQLDIPKPPKLNEPVELNWSISSIRDVSGVTAEVLFQRMKGTMGLEVPSKDILVNGNLNWYGSLRESEPVDFFAIIKFPKEGDWKVCAQCRYYDKSGMSIESGCVFYMHIDKEKSRWGWTESHENPYKGPPPSPTPAPVEPVIIK